MVSPVNVTDRQTNAPDRTTPTPETTLGEADRGWATERYDLHWKLVEVLSRFRREHDGTFDNIHMHASMVERLVRSHPAPEPYRPTLWERIVWRVRFALGREEVPF